MHWLTIPTVSNEAEGVLPLRQARLPANIFYCSSRDSK